MIAMTEEELLQAKHMAQHGSFPNYQSARLYAANTSQTTVLLSLTSNCDCHQKQQVMAAAAMSLLDTEHATPRSCMSNLVSACLCGVHEAAAANAYTSTPHMSVRACQEGPAGLYYNLYTLHYKNHASHNQKCRPY